MGRSRRVWVMCSLAWLASACNTASSRPGDRDGEIIIECDTRCPARGVREGNSSISGDREIDAYFLAGEQLLRASTATARALREARASVANLGLDTVEARDALQQRFALAAMFAVEPGPPRCEIVGVGLAEFLALSACECETREGATSCDAACDGGLRAPSAPVFTAQALELRGAAELRCSPQPVTWSAEATSSTPLAELDAFEATAGARLATGFAALERASRLLAALSRAREALGVDSALEARINAKFAETDDLPQDARLRQHIGLTCALSELRPLRDVLEAHAERLRGAVVEWARLTDALTPP